MPRFPGVSRSCLVLPFAVALVMVGSRWAAAQVADEPIADFDTLQSRVRNELKAGDHAAALPDALHLTQLDRTRYEGHLLAGITYYRQHDLPNAEASLNIALSLAPATARQEVRAALDLVEAAKRGQVALDQARAAESRGLYSKAAELYERAWNEVRADPAPGLKAARLWRERLSNPVKAARILRVISGNRVSLGDQVAVQAAQEASARLMELNLLLYEAWSQSFFRGRELAQSGQLREALESYVQAADAAPERGDTYVAIAALHVRWGRWGHKRRYAEDALLKGIQRGATIDDITGEEPLLMLVSKPSFVKFLGETLGPAGIARARAKQAEVHAALTEQYAGVWVCSTRYEDRSGSVVISVAPDLSVVAKGRWSCESDDGGYERGSITQTLFHQTPCSGDRCAASFRVRGQFESQSGRTTETEVFRCLTGHARRSGNFPCLDIDGGTFLRAEDI